MEDLNLWQQFTKAVEQLKEKLGAWLENVVLATPNFLLAIMVMLVAAFASGYLKTYLLKGMRRFSNNSTVNGLFANIGSVLLMIVALFIGLDIMHLDKALTSLLAGAGVAGLAIGLAIQEPLINLVSGIMMSTRKFYNIGDVVETNGYFGTIRRVSLRSTVIYTPLCQEVVIPNKMVIQNPFKNYTRSGERKVEVTCGISYGDDLDKVENMAKESILKQVEFDDSRPVEFFYTGFGDSSINFAVRFFMDTQKQPDFLQARSQAVKALKKTFNEHSITIPFPIRTLDFGVKGGKGLENVMTAYADHSVGSSHN